MPYDSARLHAPALALPAPERPEPVTLDHARAHAALGHLSAVADRKTSIPVLAGALVAHDGRVLKVTTTDLDLRGDARFPSGAGGAPWAVVVDAAAFAKVVQKTRGKADRVTLEPETDADGAVTGLAVTVGRTRIALESAAPVGDFPNAGPTADDAALATGGAVVDRAALAEVFTRCNSAISTEETRYYLQGVFLHLPGAFGRDGAESPDPDGRYTLRAVATDGHRLCELDSPIRLRPWASGAASDMPGQIVPGKAAKLAGKLLTAKGAPDLALLEFSAAACRVTVDGVSLTARGIDGTFPDYTRVMPRGDDVARIDAAEFAEALKGVQVVADRNRKCLRLDLSRDGGTASMQGETGHASHPFGADLALHVDEHATGFNVAYLGDMLGAFGTPDVLDMAQGSAGDPARFTVPGDALTVVLMPMRR